MTKAKKTDSFKKNPHFAYPFIKAFIDGARTQIERLYSAQQMLKHDTVGAIYRCYHETSNLFEDLATIIKYLDLCGMDMKHYQHFVDIRDLIRHDIREEFDKDENRKKERQKRLKINQNMQIELSFDVGDIKAGGITITLKEITDFLNIAEQLANALFLGVPIGTAEETKK